MKAEKSIMKVFISNKLEKLLQCLSGRLKEPLRHPLSPETIVVQSAGMAKWISLQLAQRQGIAANYVFPFPKKILGDIFRAFLPDDVPDSSFEVQVLAWTILEVLPELSGSDDFLPIRHYLGNSEDQQKRYQLAKKIAETFDQYLIFRPEMILEWEAGIVKDSRDIWQAKLWNRITARRGRMHPARLRKLLLSVIGNKPAREEVLPERLSIFGISYLPPYYLEIFFRLSVHLPVQYYYLNPSREFWADIRSQREISSALGKVSEHLMTTDDDPLHMESGNSLLASWGRQGRDFFRLMENVPAEDIDLFEKPEAVNLLSAIQSDIDLLQEHDSADSSGIKWTREDDSIQIHSCHSPLREIETLHDVLLRLFEKNRDLAPKDVLVMTPHIERYAPLIEAVFDSREPKIPYAIADRGPLSTSAVGLGLASLLDLAEGRFTSDAILAILENAAVNEMFGISSADLEQIRHWISETRIKWGIDAAHRETFDLPAFSQNTWRQGLDRLLAGAALDGRQPAFFGNVLPYGGVESEQTQVLGLLMSFWEKVIDLRKILLVPHTLSSWCEILQDILDNFFSQTGSFRHELTAVRHMISTLKKEQQAADLSELISLGILKDYVLSVMGDPGELSGFLAGGVSFCALLPMRSIPFRVLCLVGMNHDAYPRQDRQTGFNILERERKAGDRSPRRDDQYLFLEALLSARQNLIISYVGQSATDKSELLPSVLVSEFLDYLDKNYGAANGRPVSSLITRKHRLHGFSPVYYGSDDTLFGYSRQNFLAARSILMPKKAQPRFVEEALAATDERPEVISLSELVLFYRHPARYFLEKRLCLKLPAPLRKEEEDSEPFKLDPLTAYQIKQALVESHLKSQDEHFIYDVKNAEGVLPVGSAGDYYFDRLNRQAREYARRVSAYLKGEPLADYSVDLRIGDYRVLGVLDHLYGQARIDYRMATLKMNDFLSGWITHLILNMIPDRGLPQTSLILGGFAFWKLKPVGNAEKLLITMIRYYCLGRTKPLKFFARTSWEYAQALWLKKKSSDDAIRAARLIWSGNNARYSDAECQETSCRICFENDDPIDTEFAETTAAVLKDLFMHLEELE
ncbi:MAG: exodeoxyribonuclease V subunit gamma [Deltaproteobacteria bacterium]|nr:exodeoxyribonuclease V subunit gamma [Deltaproteobacteria bacterium]